MKKKVMLIVPMLHQGGFERVCVETARMLEPFYEVYIVIFSGADIAYDIRGLHVMDIHMKSVSSRPGKIRNVFRRSRRVARLKKELEIDIAYSFGPTANLVNVLSQSTGKVWCGVRSYMDMGNPGLLRLFCRRADRVICCSRLIEKELREKYGCPRAVTLYNPFDIALIQEQSREEGIRLPFADARRVIISVGREDDVKGFWHLIKSFYLLHEKYEDARLIIVGDGDFQEYWRLAEKLGIVDAVSFPGVRRNPFPYLAHGSIYVMTSLNEGFPNVLVEAMALGKPVISTNCMTGPAEILTEDFSISAQRTESQDGEYGILIPPMEKEKNLDPSVITEEEQALAKQMERLFEDEKLYEKYSAAALRRAADFSREAYVKALRQMVEAD